MRTDVHTYICTYRHALYPNTDTAFTLPPPFPPPQLTGHGRIGQCCHNPNERSQQSVRCGGSLQWSPERDTPHITATGRTKPGMTATQSRRTNGEHSGQYQSRQLKLVMKMNDREILNWPAKTPWPFVPTLPPYPLRVRKYEDLTRTIRTSKILEAAVVLRH